MQRWNNSFGLSDDSGMYIYIKHRLLTSPKYFIAQLKGRKPLKNKPESGVINSKDGALNKSNLLKFSPLSLNIKLIISLLYYNKKSLHICTSAASCIFPLTSTYSYASGLSYFLQRECLMFGKYWNKLNWVLYNAYSCHVCFFLLQVYEGQTRIKRFSFTFLKAVQNFPPKLAGNSFLDIVNMKNTF